MAILGSETRYRVDLSVSRHINRFKLAFPGFPEATGDTYNALTLAKNRERMKNIDSGILQLPIVTKFSWILIVARHYCIGELPDQVNLSF